MNSSVVRSGQILMTNSSGGSDSEEFMLSNNHIGGEKDYLSRSHNRVTYRDSSN